MSSCRTGILARWLDELNSTAYAQVINETVNEALNRAYRFDHDLISQDAAPQPGAPWQLAYCGYDDYGARVLTNPKGAVTDTCEYGAFGELLAHTGTTKGRYRSSSPKSSVSATSSLAR